MNRTFDPAILRPLGGRFCLRVFWTLILPLVVVAPIAQATDSTRPNILFVLGDDISYRNISCYEGSYPWVETPNIDRLAEQGVRFTRGYIGAWCMPARATLMTGHHQYGNESIHLRLARYPSSKFDPEEMPLWPTALRENGYFTGMIGKWHIGKADGWGTAWDHQKVWNRCRHPGNAHAYYEAQLIETDGGASEWVDGYSTDFYTDWAIDFVEGKTRAAPEKPWFLWLCYGAAHSPFTPADRDLDRFPDTFVPAPADVFPPRQGKPDYMQKIQKWSRGPDGRPIMEKLWMPNGRGEPLFGPDVSQWNRQYQQTIASLDDNLGRLMEALEKSGQRENTLVIFAADQGFAFAQHGFATKMAPYDANIRPPMIFSRPGHLPEGAVCKHPVSGPDLVSTLLAQAGTAEPWEMHGYDFSPLLRDPNQKEWEHGAMTAMTGLEWGDSTRKLPKFFKLTQGVPWWVSYSKGSYKYIRTLQDNEIEELYDLDSDPEELNNLASSPEFYMMVQDFRAITIAELERTHSPLLKMLPPVRELGVKVDQNAPSEEPDGKKGLLKRIGIRFTSSGPPEEEEN